MTALRLDPWNPADWDLDADDSESESLADAIDAGRVWPITAWSPADQHEGRDVDQFDAYRDESDPQ